MKSPIKVSILVWTCNILLILMGISLVAGSFYYFKLPGIIDRIPELETNGSSGISSFTFSQNFMGDSFIMKRIINRPEGIDEEGYYFASVNNVYTVSIDDSLEITADRINTELSSDEASFLGFKRETITVKEAAGTVPVRYVSPAISLDREEFIAYAKSNVLYLLLSLLFGMIFTWFLRKFISGLRDKDFFTRKNSLHLKVTAWMAIAAPFLLWIWNSFFRPDFFAEYQFSGTAEVSSGFGLPTSLLFFGLILLVIAWCFDQGVKLQKEQELTI